MFFVLCTEQQPVDEQRTEAKDESINSEETPTQETESKAVIWEMRV